VNAKVRSPKGAQYSGFCDTLALNNRDRRFEQNVWLFNRGFWLLPVSLDWAKIASTASRAICSVYHQRV
jgi:hypothetical protein